MGGDRRLIRLAGAALAALVLLGAPGCGSSGASTDQEPQPRETPSSPERAELKPCGSDVRIKGLLCGSIAVPKFRSDPDRGNLEIGFAVRPRDDRSTPAEGTIFAVEGGPGYSTIGTANSYARLFGDLLEHRDLVLVDMRGTGRSGPVRCPDLQSGRAPGWIALPECARRLGDDFEAYATGPAAEDLDDVRAALGLGRITLYGDSYGTYLAQSYAFRHPGRLQALVLDGAYPVRGESPWYPSLIKAGNRDMRIACSRDPRCPPGAGRRLERAAQLMRRRGMRVGALIDAIAAGAYSPPGAYLRVDRALRKLLAGRPRAWRRLNMDETVAFRDRTRYDHSQELAVSCNDYPMIWDRRAGEAERRIQLERAIRGYDDDAFGPFTPREVAIGSETGHLECLTWPRPTERREPPVPAGAEPTDAPVLVVNGELDDLTTPFEGRLVAREFPDARTYVGRNAGHVDSLYDAQGPSAHAIRRFLRGVYDGATG
jgi:pimeloyl-ACP methyl ester carboxylesterase